MGNKLFGDDGAGILTAEILSEHLADQKQIKIETSSWGGFRIIDLFEGFNSAIVIDTIQTGKKPIGFIHQFNQNDLINSVRMVSFHDINFATSIELAKALDIKMPEEITVYAIEIINTTCFSDEISTTVMHAVNKCVNRVLRKLSADLNIKTNYKNKNMNVRGCNVR